MMKNEKLVKKLNEKAKLASRFIDEVLYPRDDTTKSLLDDFKNVLLEFQKGQDIGNLRKLREIDSRATAEGAETDYTTGISLPIDGYYTSLSELMLEIEDLVFELEKN